MKSVVQPVIRPDFARGNLGNVGNVGAVKASTWRLGTPERQGAAVDAIARAWEEREWPTAALLSYTVLTGTDGDTLFHYSQWADELAYEEFFRTARDDRNTEIDAAVPGIVRVGLHGYEPYRSIGAAAETPGCVVVVEADFDPAVPDAARAFVDLVLEAQATDPAPAVGGISGNFHIHAAGSRMLNYAEWDSEQAHIDALSAPGTGIGSDTEQWRRVLDFPALTAGRFHRYAPALSLTAQA